MHYFYLHGFASSPQSRKAQELGDRFTQRHLPLRIPDLNQGDFHHLTLTRQLHQVGTEIAARNGPITLIGASFGGLTAAWLGQQHPQVERLVLLAPAFQFLDHWLPKLGTAQLQQWQTQGDIAVYHYGANQLLPLHYGFVEDCAQYDLATLQRPIPTLILHGQHDEVIPIAASQEFARDRPWVQLHPLNTDHGMLDSTAAIWTAIQNFCHL